MNKNERYGNGKIYKLVNNVDDEIYIGSTCLPLAKRKACHKQLAMVKPDRRIYSHLNNVGWDNVDIILIEAYPCDSKMELEKRERYYIETFKPSLNIKIPTRTIKESGAEYRKQNKEKISENKKKYRHANRDILLEKQSKYREAHREELRLKAIEYNRNNSEQIKARSKLYREKNREAINAKKSAKILCVCGIETDSAHKARHERTKRHIDYISNLNP